MANLKFPDIKKVGSDRPKIITDKVFKLLKRRKLSNGPVIAPMAFNK